MVLNKVEALKNQGRESKHEVKILKFEIEKEIQDKKKENRKPLLGPNSPHSAHFTSVQSPR